ncbi:MAG: hypothetical protein KDK76_01950 [Chlamydiia bacterium]|nr:hypothetical protein [Chlamydiia bacterium]
MHNGIELELKSIAPALTTAALFYMGARYGKIEGAAKGTIFVALAAVARGIHEKGCDEIGRAFCNHTNYDIASAGLIALGMAALKTSFKTRLVTGALLFGAQRYLEIANRKPNMAHLIANGTRETIDETIKQIDASFGEDFPRDDGVFSYLRAEYFNKMKKLFTVEELRGLMDDPTSTYHAYFQEHKEYRHKDLNIAGCVNVLIHLGRVDLTLFEGLERGDEEDQAEIARYMREKGNLIKARWEGKALLENATRETCDDVVNQASQVLGNLVEEDNKYLCVLRRDYFNKMKELFTTQELVERMNDPNSTFRKEYEAHKKFPNKPHRIIDCINLFNKLELTDLSLFETLEGPDVSEEDHAGVASYMQREGNLIKARWEGKALLENATRETCDNVMNQASQTLRNLVEEDDINLCFLRRDYFDKMKELFTTQELVERMNDPNSTFRKEYEAHKKFPNKPHRIMDCIDLLYKLRLADLSLFETLEGSDVSEEDQAGVARYMERKGTLIKARWEGKALLENATRETCDNAVSQASQVLGNLVEEDDVDLCTLRRDYFDKMKELFTEKELVERMNNPDSTFRKEYEAHKKFPNKPYRIMDCIDLFDELGLTDLSLFETLETADRENQEAVANYMKRKGAAIKANWKGTPVSGALKAATYR